MNTGCFKCDKAQWDADGCTCEITGLLVGNAERGCEYCKDAKLKPCPFCGGENVRVVYWDEEEQNEKAWERGTIQDENHYLCVKCGDCDIVFFGGVPIRGEELIGAWNRRAGNDN